MSRFAVRDGKMSGTDLKSIAAVIEGSQDYSAADSRCDRYVAWRNVFRAASRTRDTEVFYFMDSHLLFLQRSFFPPEPYCFISCGIMTSSAIAVFAPEDSIWRIENIFCLS